jgi:hypothetical protein
MSKRLRVKTPQGMGFIFDGTPLAVQIERKRVGVVLDNWHGPMRYFYPHEIEVWGATIKPLVTQQLPSTTPKE